MTTIFQIELSDLSNARKDQLAERLMYLFRGEKRDGLVTSATVDGEDLYTRPINGQPNSFVA